MTKYTAITICLILLAGINTGCQAIKVHHAKVHPAIEPEKTERQPIPGVVLGGQVRNPGIVPFNKGLTVSQGLAFAGGFAPIRENQYEFEFLQAMVCLSRGLGLENQRIYIPLNYVEQSAAGEIRLQPNDTLKIVDLRHTGLHESGHPDKQDQPTQGVAVAGMVNRASLFPKNDIPAQFSQIGSFVGVSSQSDVVLLRRDRPNRAGTKDVFIFPRFRKQLVDVTRSTATKPVVSTSSFSQTKPDDLDPDKPIAAGGELSSSDLDAALGRVEEATTKTTGSKPVESATETVSALPIPRSPMEMSVLSGDEIVFTNLVAIPTVYQSLTKPVAERLARRKAAVAAAMASKQKSSVSKLESASASFLERLKSLSF